MLTRRLALRKETLTALTPSDLAGVVGAADTATCITCLECVLDDVTSAFQSLGVTNCCQGIPTFHRAAC